MKRLPRNAKLYLAAVFLTGIAVLGTALHGAWTSASWLGKSPHGWDFGMLSLLVLLSALVGSKKISLIRNHGVGEAAGSLSLGYLLTFLTLLRFGLPGAMLADTFACLSICFYPRRQRPEQIAFNLCMSWTQSWLSGLVFIALNQGLALHSYRLVLPAVLASSLTYFLLNTLSISLIIGFATSQSPAKIWREEWLWTGPSYFISAGGGALATWLCGDQLARMVIFIGPVAYLLYQSYATYTAQSQEKQKRIEALAQLHLATVRSLAQAIDAKDQRSHQHILRVQKYALAIADEIGISEPERDALNAGALLHDIGKLGIPEHILLKPGRLTPDELVKVRQHPELGAAILAPVDFPYPVLDVVRHHHERWDGGGYPYGLKGEAIPLTARILSVADVYDSLTTYRAYRPARTPEQSKEKVVEESGTRFDPAVVAAFLRVIDQVGESSAEGGPAVAETATTASVAAREGEAAEAARHIQRASSELWALYEVAQTLSSSLGVDETLEILARKLEALLPGTACLFLLREGEADKGTERLVARAAVGLNREFFTGCGTVGAQSASLTAVQTHAALCSIYDPDDLMLNSVEGAEWTPLGSALIVPVIHQGAALGTINLYHPNTGAFSAHDQELLITIAERAALALYNGLLFDRTRSQAYTDPLTGLYNLRYLTQHVEEKCRQPSPAPFALLCLDLDSFKPINDNFGHQKGDVVLADLGRLFRQSVGPHDVVSRYGGDEFLVVLDQAGPEEAAAMARALQECVESYDPGLRHETLGDLRLGVSVGFGCFPQDGQDCAALLSAADAHMYRRKMERKLGGLAERQKRPILELSVTDYMDDDAPRKVA